MAENKGILIYAETVDGNLSNIATEILGCGRRLADEIKEDLACVIVSNTLGDAAKKAISYGADKVYLVSHSILSEYQNGPFVVAIEKLVKDMKPHLVLFGQTSIGRDLAPSLAFKIGSGLSMDCLDIKYNTSSSSYEFTRSVYGGNAQATFSSGSEIKLATIRQKAMAPIVPDESRKGDTIEYKIDFDTSTIKTKIIDTIKEEVAGVKLEDASIIVSGGRGIGSNDGFKQLEELAKVLKGAVGATRPPCDNGWWPETSQVGLTGKIVSPDLYIAMAISGASQHMAGCSGSKNIVAINKDADANIFKYARFGIIADWKQALPAFTERIKQLLAS
jgi:electron transfer flavoprotein alpha subunit